MKYFIDQEFAEGFKLGWNLRHYHTIELIQIGIVAEDGRTYTAINKNFNPKHANQWVKDNVLKAIVLNYLETRFGQERLDLIADLEGKTVEQSFKYLQRRIGKSQKQIAAEVFDFVNPDLGYNVSAYNNSEFKNPDSYVSKLFDAHNVTLIKDHYYAQPEFYGYYCSFDHVLLASIFGTMPELPSGFPMFMIDLQQDFHSFISEDLPNNYLSDEYNAKKSTLMNHRDYPLNKIEHDALSDAKWNYEFYLFLNKIKNETNTK